ncbi:MAG: hypothetical protein EON93_09565 [Burkholderiales bacterium]|nr:MAG: hypothetical protein EON93_09565 [Burkholderiales bacterium]
MPCSHILAASVLVPAFLLGAAPTLAADEPARAIRLEEAPGQPAAISDAPFANAMIADDVRLADATGMADTNTIQQAANVTITSNVSGNLIQGDPETGAISIGGGAFNGFNGLALVNANTGNNVSMSAAMNVNVAFQQ